MTLIEMEGFLSGKCLPGDMLVNETNAQYLHRKLNAATELQRQLTAYEATVTNLTAQVLGLAGENAELKAFGDKLNEMHNDLNGTGTGIQGGYEVACQQLGLEAAMEEFDAIETPATDTVLAEIRNEARAEGAALCVKALVTSDDDSFEDAPNICANVALQLRKEQGK